MNAVWVVIPAILLYDAAALSIARRPAGAAPPSARAGAYWVVAATLLSYITLVPAALLMAQR